MSDDIRTLAQAVVSAYETYDGERTASVGRDYIVIDDCRARYYAACKALEAPLDMLSGSIAVASARAILAALNAERAQGYARAMGDAADRAMAVASSYGPKPASGYAEGAQDALHSLADDLDGTAKLARERLPAAAERD